MWCGVVCCDMSGKKRRVVYLRENGGERAPHIRARMSRALGGQKVYDPSDAARTRDREHEPSDLLALSSVFTVPDPDFCG